MGAGSIGSRHARNLRALGIEDLSVWDPEPARAQIPATAVGATVMPSFDAGLSTKPDLVIVCSPPPFHIDQAIASLRAGAHVFIEKPLSNSLARISELESASLDSGRVVQVGYNLRFHPALVRIKALVDSGLVGRVLWMRAEFGQYLPDWRPAVDYRTTYTARREMGGGVILDASHEIDYVLWLIGGAPVEIQSMCGKVSSLDVDVEDCATILLRFPSGTQADIHLDFIQRAYSRGCKIAGELATIEWTYGERLRTFWVTDEKWTEEPDRASIEETYVAEIRHFLDCVSKGAEPVSNLATARLALEVALAASGA